MDGPTHKIVDAIRNAEKGTTGEIRVHFTKKRLEPDTFKRASYLFSRYGMNRTTQKNATLIYVNQRKRQFAILCDEGLSSKLTKQDWTKIETDFRQDLSYSHPEKAVCHVVETLGSYLKKYFSLENLKEMK